MSAVRLAIVAGIVFAVPCQAFKEGAPLKRCANMAPGHKPHPNTGQTGPPPYRLLVDEGSLASDGMVTVTVQGETPNNQFAGLLLQSRRSPDDPTPLGRFSDVPEGFKTLDCAERVGSAVTHSINIARNKTDFRWESPYDFDGDIVFVATVVANYSTFWTGVKSQPIKINKRSAPDSGPPSEPTISPLELETYNGCGSDKICVGSAEGCIENKNCIALVSVKNVGNLYDFEMFSKDGSKYVAYGISQDNKMGGDSVTECVFEDQPRAYRSWNLPNAKQNQRSDEYQSGFSVKSIKYEDNLLYCKVNQEPYFTMEDNDFDLEKKSYYLLLAAGKSLKERSVGFHDIAYKSSQVSRKFSEAGPVEKYDDFYNDCNVLKNCFGYPKDCELKHNCEAIVSVLVQGNKYFFEMKAKSASYVAVGLSEDNKMGGDSVVECVNEGDGTVKAYMSWNVPGKKENRRKGLNQAYINLVNGSVVDGYIYCKFTRQILTTVEQKSYDLTKDKYFLLLASGSALKSESVGFHDLVYIASDEKNLLSNVGAFAVGSRLLLRLHGAFMVAAWIGAASIGIVLARYYKQTWVGSSFCTKDLWFAWHRCFMLLTWCLTLAGFVLIFIEIGEWVNLGSQTHAILGCITTVLCFIQPIGAAFRPHPTARNRPVFNWLHWFIGNSAHILSIVTIFFAVPIKKVELPDWLDWILVAYVAFYVLMHILLSISAFISDRSNGKRVNSFPMKDITARIPLNSVERRVDTPHSGFRKCMLSIHIIGVLILTIAIIVIIVLAPIEAQWDDLKNKVMSL